MYTSPYLVFACIIILFQVLSNGWFCISESPCLFNSICTYGADAVAAKTEILSATHCQFECQVVWPNLAIYWTLGNFLKPLATINLLRSATSLGNFCVGAKILNFSSETIFGQLLWTFGDFSLVTLISNLVRGLQHLPTHK